ncbi:hypothetical protein LCGC14_1243490 [marine sediment metagenome]|uniref:ATP-dependent helicase C-terminal domain-containing protein n=1 Tax=marine sediment metagenome TaxID=412755 RepID=A0A0F9NMD1_9ZZZZ
MIFPSNLGFNDKRFPEWRPQQWDIIAQIMNWYQTPEAEDFLILEAPAGWGKSLIAGAVHMLAIEDNAKHLGVITTTTLNLQKQYVEETMQPQTVDPYNAVASAWGRGNYQCLISPAKVDEAPCVHGYKCPSRPICPYYVQRDLANKVPVAVLNTAFYLAGVNYVRNEERGTLFSSADLAIHDEAHLLENSVRSFVEVSLSRSFFADLKRPLPESNEYGTWEDWIETNIELVRVMADRYQRISKELAPVIPDDPAGKKAVTQFRAMRDITLKMLPTRPLIDRDHFGVKFRAVWGKYFAPDYLFDHARRHILMSATILNPEYLASTLGILPHQFRYISLPSPFAAMRRRIIYDPVIKVNAKTSKEDFQKVVDRMDQHIDDHLEDKGIVHTVSYERARTVYAGSRHKSRMIVHERGREQKEDAVRRFLEAPPGAILVSPAVGVGEDFGRDDNCRFQIFVKYPIPYLGDPVVRARSEDDPDSLWVEADMAFVQAVGRGMRSETDYCVNYLLDAGAAWRFQFLPKSIQDSIVKSA